MVKADVKHNYYADLDLPSSCTIDEVKKQYRKLALQYHPDRNAGKEEEFVPKFQAIQTAHEILADPTLKNKYDLDRRKAGLYPTSQTFRANQPSPGNPYATSCAYPPPPRRTQPGTWQRPQPTATAGPTPSGADRFTNFPRAAPTARKEPAQDRTNVFRAWQNMNNAQERQQRFTGSAQPPSNKTRPPPPPRNDTRMPTEEEIRAGMSHRKAPPAYDPERVDQSQSAWSAFQQAKVGKPSAYRSSTSRTPKKQGFDPNIPGSDERPAGTGNYTHAHRTQTADFGPAQSGPNFPPPPPGPPPHSPQSPLSPSSPSTSRPGGDPLKHFKNRTIDEQVPFFEGNRIRTPYTNFSGEKTTFSSDGLRRSASTRDTSKLNADGPGATRARSTSPLTRQDRQSMRPPFVNYSSSEASGNDPDLTRTPEEFDSPDRASDHATGPSSVPHAERPKKIPSPPSKHFNGSSTQFNPPPSEAPGDATSSNEMPGMQQKQDGNMYAPPSSFINTPSQSPRFNPISWASQMFGTNSTCGAERRNARVPQWAIPSTILPKKTKRQQLSSDATPSGQSFGAIDEFSLRTTASERYAYQRLRHELEIAYGHVPEGFDMEIFLRLAYSWRRGMSFGHGLLDRLLGSVVPSYPFVGLISPIGSNADVGLRRDSFTIPIPPEQFSPHSGMKSRSEENINTSFSPEGWDGTFTGSPDYFAPPATMRKAASPAGRSRQRSAFRSGTSRVSQVNMSSGDLNEMPPPPRSSELEETAQPPQSTAEVKFSKEQWEKTFQDASWTWPPPPPNPPSPVKGASRAKTSSRKQSRSSTKPSVVGPKGQPHIVEDDDDTVVVKGEDGRPERGAPVALDDADAMDIDTTSPKQSQVNVPGGVPSQADQAKEPRRYSVPPSTWRQEQLQRHQISNGHDGKTSGSSRRSQRSSLGDTKLGVDLDDLAKVEPIVRNPGTDGLQNLADMSSTLPFESQPAPSLSSQPLVPQQLQMPPLPKAPEPPQKLTKQSWHTFTQAFGAYLQAFHAFNNTMLQHFTAREKQAEVRMSAGMDWLQATGDTSGMLRGPSGFGTYMQGVREDEKVREAWNLGCEKHLEACKGLEMVRERVRRLVAGGVLVDR